jgi:hypothetical protein
MGSTRGTRTQEKRNPPDQFRAQAFSVHGDVDGQFQQTGDRDPVPVPHARTIGDGDGDRDGERGVRALGLRTEDLAGNKQPKGLLA